MNVVDFPDAARLESRLYRTGATPVDVDCGKHANAIFSKLGLADEPVHRRVAAVLAFLRELTR